MITLIKPKFLNHKSFCKSKVMRWGVAMKISVTNILVAHDTWYNLCIFSPLKFDDLIYDEKGVPWDATWQIF